MILLVLMITSNESLKQEESSKSILSNNELSSKYIGSINLETNPLSSDENIRSPI
jgi:hypothetical protein